MPAAAALLNLVRHGPDTRSVRERHHHHLCHLCLFNDFNRFPGKVVRVELFQAKRIEQAIRNAANVTCVQCKCRKRMMGG